MCCLWFHITILLLHHSSFCFRRTVFISCCRHWFWWFWLIKSKNVVEIVKAKKCGKIQKWEIVLKGWQNARWEVVCWEMPGLWQSVKGRCLEQEEKVKSSLSSSQHSHQAVNSTWPSIIDTKRLVALFFFTFDFYRYRFWGTWRGLCLTCVVIRTHHHRLSHAADVCLYSPDFCVTMIRRSSVIRAGLSATLLTVLTRKYR